MNALAAVDSAKDMWTSATNETWAAAAAAASATTAAATAVAAAARSGGYDYDDGLGGHLTAYANLSMQSRSYDVHNNGTVDDSGTTPGYFDVCSSLLMSVKVKYSGPYGYVACVLCSVGVLLNATNIVVLTRRQMLSPVNCLLTLVAAAEMGIVGLQLPAAVYFYVLRDPRLFATTHMQDERPAALWYHVIATSGSVLCQTAAAWAMVAVAAFRYVSICHHQLGERLCTLRHARAACAAIVCLSAALLLPSWLTIAVTPAASLSYCAPPPQAHSAVGELNDDYYGGGRNWWTLGYTSLVEEGPAFLSASSWLFASGGKIVPAALLAVLTALLVSAMRGIERRRVTLVNARRSSGLTAVAGGCERTSAAVAAAVASATAHVTGSDPAASKSSRRAREQRRATRVLLAVVAVWLAVELPQGVMLAVVCSGYVDFIFAYELLGDLFNTSTLLAMSVNFFLYTSMMRRFRITFCRTFLRCALFSRLHGDGSKSGGGHAGKFINGCETSVTLRYSEAR